MMAPTAGEFLQQLGLHDVSDLAGFWASGTEAAQAAREAGLSPDGELLVVREWRTAQSAVEVVDNLNTVGY